MVIFPSRRYVLYTIVDYLIGDLGEELGQGTSSVIVPSNSVNHLVGSTGERNIQ